MDNFSGEEFEETFVTWLPPKFYLSANYQWPEGRTLGFRCIQLSTENIPGFLSGYLTGNWQGASTLC